MRNSQIFIFLMCLFLLSGCKLNEYKFVSQCEETFKEGLKSPSSYKRIEYDILKRKLSRDEYKEYLGPEYSSWRLDLYDDGSTNPTEITAIIKYDATNTYGGVLRDTFTCNIINYSSDKISKVYDHMISINGIPYFDYKFGRY